MPPAAPNNAVDDIEEEVPGTSLEGLASLWENDRGLRSRALKSQSLLAWPLPEQVGVINFDTMKSNARVVMLILEKWAPQVTTAKTVNIDQLREEDWFLKHVCVHNCYCFGIASKFQIQPNFK